MTKSAIRLTPDGWPRVGGSPWGESDDMTSDLRRRLLQDMIRIRRTEETLAELYPAQEMRTPTHFSIGQEAVAVGVCATLQQTDAIYSGHRCHAHYLAKGGDLVGMVAELYGKETGCARGRGGSVHLNDPAAGVLASSAILGETMAVAVGSALAFEMDGLPRVAVSFFGDGDREEGIFHEALNFAVVKKVPVLFVCENNGFSTHTPPRRAAARGRHDLGAGRRIRDAGAGGGRQRRLRGVRGRRAPRWPRCRARRRAGLPRVRDVPLARARRARCGTTTRATAPRRRSTPGSPAAPSSAATTAAHRRTAPAPMPTSMRWHARARPRLTGRLLPAKASPVPRRRRPHPGDVLRLQPRDATLNYGQAISEATVQCMEADPSIFVAGIGVDDFKGIFGTTLEAHRPLRRRPRLRHPELRERLDRHRHRRGRGGQAPADRPPAERLHVPLPWISSSTSLRSGGTCSPTAPACRSCCAGIVGRGWGQGATHSQSLHAMFAHFPGLYVGLPATPADAKGLLVSALRGTGSRGDP